MKKILLITTGGTIACKQTENGLAPGLTPDDILSYIPSVKNICEVHTSMVCHIDSTNVTSKHWKMVVETIQKNYDKYDGFVICHGTDTLAYTAAALSYMIQNSDKPIIITGSQKPIQMDVTDAKANLLDSFIYAVDNNSRNVNVVFNGKVIAGTRVRKERTKTFNAFSSLNYPVIAVIQDGMVIRYIDENPVIDDVCFYTQMSDKVCNLKLIPGIKPDILSYLFKNYDCIVIESYGVGGIPENLMDVFYCELSKGIREGKCVVMTTQIAREGSNMTVYEVGKKVKNDFSLIEAYDMTFEAAVTKLMWILGMGHKDYEIIRKIFYTPINHDTLFAQKLENI